MLAGGANWPRMFHGVQEREADLGPARKPKSFYYAGLYLLVERRSRRALISTHVPNLAA